MKYLLSALEYAVTMATFSDAGRDPAKLMPFNDGFDTSKCFAGCVIRHNSGGIPRSGDYEAGDGSRVDEKPKGLH